MTLCTSVLWMIFMSLAKKWLEMIVKRTFMPVANFGDQSLSQMKFENLWALINISGCHITKSPKLGEPRILPNLNDRRQRHLKSNHHHHYTLKFWSFKLLVLIRIIMPKKHMFDTYLVFLSAFKSIPKCSIIFVNYKKGYMNYSEVRQTLFIPFFERIMKLNFKF